MVYCCPPAHTHTHTHLSFLHKRIRVLAIINPQSGRSSRPVVFYLNNTIWLALLIDRTGAGTNKPINSRKHECIFLISPNPQARPFNASSATATTIHGVPLTFRRRTCRSIVVTIRRASNTRSAVRSSRLSSFRWTTVCYIHREICFFSLFLFVLFLFFSFCSPVPIDTRIIRICGWDDSSYKGKCYHRSGFGGRQEVCSCETDNCNGAGAIQLSHGVIGLLIICVVGKSFIRWPANANEMKKKKKCYFRF